MDPNQNQNQNIPNPSPPQAPVSPPAGNVPPETPKPNGKILLFIAVGILLLILLGAIYFISQRFGSQNQPAQITPIPTQALPTSTPTPTPLSEKDIDTIDLGNPEAELKNIEDDVGQL